jgi:hypothetical protein
MKEYIKKLLRENFGYRAGDFINKAELLRNFMGSRGSGHFGTGYYFFGDKDKADEFGKLTNRGVNSINLDDYNMLVVKNDSDGYKLHDELKKWNELRMDGLRYKIDLAGDKYLIGSFSSSNNELIDYIRDKIYNETNEYIDDSDIKHYLTKYLNDGGDDYDKLGKVLYELLYDLNGGIDGLVEHLVDYIKKYRVEFIRKNYKLLKGSVYKVLLDDLYDLASIVSKIGGGDAYKFADILENALIKSIRRDPYIESHSNKTTIGTELIKSLGYEGIDVRGTGLDNSMYGSVLYDLKK